MLLIGGRLRGHGFGGIGEMSQHKLEEIGKGLNISENHYFIDMTCLGSVGFLLNPPFRKQGS